MDGELFERSINAKRSINAFVNKNIVTEKLISRLGNTLTLEGHAGCVNSLDWNSNGTLLASGSDDQFARIWDCSGNCLHEIRTGHTHNIFSSMFLPAGGDKVLLTAAGDNTVRMHNYTHLDDEPFVFTCDGRVKRLCVAFNEPQMFWSASEDGIIREYDARTNAGKPLLKFKGKQCKTMAIDQSNTNIVAVGTTDPYIPLFDRRCVREPVMQLIPGHLTFKANGSKHTNFRQHYATHLAFNRTGDEIIANIGTEQVYIFNVKSDPGVAIDVLRDIDNFLSAPLLLEAPIVSFEQHATEKFRKLRELAKDSFGNHDFTTAIDLYSQAIAQCEKICGNIPSVSHPNAMDLVLLLANRGAGLLMRAWSGDAYACVRDMIRSLQIDPSNKKAHYRLVRALIMLKQARLGNRCSQFFKDRFPNEKSIEKLDSMLLELTNELSKHPVETEWHAATSGEKPYRDFSTRLCGHRNMSTDIKEANWWGGSDEFVVAGSDCGSLIIWERATGRMLRMLEADSRIVNIVQPHPNRCLLATSGIDDVIRFWEPLPEDGCANEKIRDKGKVSDDNNRKMQVDLLHFLVSAFNSVHHSADSFNQDENNNGNEDENENDGSAERIQCTTS